MALVAGAQIGMLDANAIRDLQTVLVRLGYPVGIDGSLSQATFAALQAFVAQNGGDPNIVDPRLAQALTNSTVLGALKGPPGFAAGTAPGGVTGGPTTGGTFQGPTPQHSPVDAATVGGFEPDAAVEEWVRETFPTMVPYLHHPDIGKLLTDAKNGGWPQSRMMGELQKTEWYKTTSAAIRSWDLLVATDKASADAQVRAKGVEVANLANRYGLQWDQGTTEWVATQIIRENWTADQIGRWFGAILRNEGNAIGAGDITATMSQVQDVAGRYLTSMNADAAREYAIRIAEKRTTLDAIETTLQEQAANRFYWLRDQIARGITPEQLFQPIRQRVANVLEINPDTIDMNDVKWATLLSPKKGEDGMVRSMNDYEALSWARSQPEWRKTQNANDSAYGLSQSLLRTLGAIA